jgi:cell pole-organizing protein PopZ
MEEILASIRRIIADDDATKSAKPAEQPAPPPVPVAVTPARPVTPPPPVRPAANNQDDIDAMLAELDKPASLAPKPAPAMPAPVKPAPPKAVAPPPVPPMPAPIADVLDLTEAMTATPPPGPVPSFRTIDGASDVVFTDRASDPPPPPPPPEPTVRALEEARRQFTQSAAMPDRSLLSSTASAAVDSAFNTLAHTVLVQNARTLEDLVKEMLRPMLKSWLDDNLPGLVERIVRAEIERVSRGRP